MTSWRGGAHRSLPLLAAFAIVFAPADEGPVGTRQGDRDIASRILAPTVRQALSSVARKETPSQVRIPDRRSGPESLPIALAATGALLLVWTSLALRASLVRRSSLTLGRSLVPRAPPALQPA